jgi:glyoxylase-like metal-dependent hydrolase (beta-lactamase superfamily II)
MTLEIVTLPLGPVRTNAYLIADSASGDAAVIDPAWDGEVILAEAQKRGWRIAHLWYTHAHFDHIGGAAAIADALNPLPLVALHPADHDLWKAAGGGPLFGFQIDPGPEPTIDFTHGQLLRLGNNTFEVRCTPGHTPGHVVLYCAEASVCFCGDLIFAGSVGRTDLPGGNWEMLVESIRKQIFSLPPETRLLSGHGEETTVDREKRSNPFVGA